MVLASSLYPQPMQLAEIMLTQTRGATSLASDNPPPVQSHQDVRRTFTELSLNTIRQTLQFELHC